ncbi:hypothetical protein B0T16DRAFT_384286 [Cercophora newfieldiana]|uniref:Uncharacterized protein n=1 Tax=Cercophora newfieldiana TaxID=92897 RepID=A0AA39YMR4_9PEZI|nr:hypothetical protein B0T16DRAFT_384286 [Cercophora newfieldiana]
MDLSRFFVLPLSIEGGRDAGSGGRIVKYWMARPGHHPSIAHRLRDADKIKGPTLHLQPPRPPSEGRWIPAINPFETGRDATVPELGELARGHSTSPMDPHLSWSTISPSAGSLVPKWANREPIEQRVLNALLVSSRDKAGNLVGKWCHHGMDINSNQGPTNELALPFAYCATTTRTDFCGGKCNNCIVEGWDCTFGSSGQDEGAVAEGAEAFSQDAARSACDSSCLTPWQNRQRNVLLFLPNPQVQLDNIFHNRKNPNSWWNTPRDHLPGNVLNALVSAVTGPPRLPLRL